MNVKNYLFLKTCTLKSKEKTKKSTVKTSAIAENEQISQIFCGSETLAKKAYICHFKKIAGIKETTEIIDIFAK